MCPGPTLFSIMFSVMLFDGFNDSDNGIDFDTALTALSSTSRLQAKTRVKTDIVNEFLFANDCALNATTKANKQNSVDKFSMACDNFDQTIGTKKTEVIRQLVPRKPYVEPNVITKGQRPEGNRKVHLPWQHPL